jgi:hypothetical protein
LLAEVGALRADLAALRAELTERPGPRKAPTAALFESEIVAEFPLSVLGEFREKRFVLLWSGARHGFTAAAFHGRCDGHANTVTLIQDTGGSIFGGFTPIAWESPSSGSCRADPSTRSFVFTLKNPRGTDPMKFSLANAQYAIYCHSGYGPVFGNGHDIYVANNSDANAASYTNLGSGYTNYTGVDGRTVFTGAHNFRAKAVEVFEITG